MEDRWHRYKRALAGEALPAVIVDLDALDRNVARVVAPIRAAHKRVRIASKSVRCPALLERIAAQTDAIGYMTYAAGETAVLGRDCVLAYPTLQASDAALIASSGTAVVVDDAAQLAPLAATGARIPIWIDVDMSWRPLGVHLGVRRSPLREPDEVVALARKITAPLVFAGVLGYEAQIAGLQDRNPIIRAIKRGSKPELAQRRARVVAALIAAGLRPQHVNGGGTGSVDWSSGDASLTEVTVGSGFLCGHLFDGYRGLDLEPAIAFALQVTRRPAANVVTCLGGGWIASGQAGADRLPRATWPHGCKLLSSEGAGEVQTPVEVPAGVALGDPIFFRPAKSGELAEHAREYLLVRGDRIVERVPTYRGLGHCFL